MSKHIAFTILSLILIATQLVGCSSSDNFQAQIEVEGLGTRNLRIFYYDGRGLRTITTPSIEGKFTVEGNSKNNTLVTIQSNYGEPIGSFIARNGDNIKLKLDINDPLKIEVSGNRESERYASLVRDNAAVLAAAPSRDADTKIARLVASNHDHAASALLLINFFDARHHPAEADSLFSLLSPKATPREIVAGYADVIAMRVDPDSDDLPSAMPSLELYGEADSLITFNVWGSEGKTLFIFTDSDNARRDSINRLVSPLKNLKSISVVNVSLEADTAEWHEALRRTPTALGKNAWVAGSVASPRLSKLKIQTLPYFIVADSVAAIVYRGQSLTAALDKI